MSGKYECKKTDKIETEITNTSTNRDGEKMQLELFGNHITKPLIFMRSLNNDISIDENLNVKK